MLHRHHQLYTTPKRIQAFAQLHGEIPQIHVESEVIVHRVMIAHVQGNKNASDGFLAVM